MPIAVLPDYTYASTPETTEELDWADLVTIDLSKFDGGEESKRKLASELLEAINTKGFFYLINFGISRQAVDRQFGIGTQFYAIPLEERMDSMSDLANGNSNGYCPAGRRTVGKDLKDRVEEYNIPIQEDPRLKHPRIIQDNLDEIMDFEHALHDKVLARLYELIALGLEIPPSSLVPICSYQGGATGILRYMRYSPFNEEELSRFDNQIFAGGHTDSCAITLLFRQPIAALQIKDPQSGEWKWVKPMKDSLTVNAADCLSILTGNYIKSTIHRVTFPPKDQRHRERLGLIYFSRPPPHMLLKTVESPVLKRAGCDKNGFEEDGNTVPTAGEFQIQKQHWQQDRSASKQGKVIIPGFKGVNYN